MKLWAIPTVALATTTVAAPSVATAAEIIGVETTYSGTVTSGNSYITRSIYGLGEDSSFDLTGQAVDITVVALDDGMGFPDVTISFSFPNLGAPGTGTSAVVSGPLAMGYARYTITQNGNLVVLDARADDMYTNASANAKLIGTLTNGEIESWNGTFGASFPGWGTPDVGFGFHAEYNTGVTTLRFAPAPAVPEPATWAFMILGFGLVGGALRRQHLSAWRKLEQR